MMQRSTDYHHILDIRKPIKVIRELVPDHRQSDSAAQACPGGTLSIFWNVEPWDCLAEWQPAATFTSQKTQKDRERNLNRPPTPDCLHSWEYKERTNPKKFTHHSFAGDFSWHYCFMSGPGKDSFCCHSSPLRLWWNLALLSFGKIHHLHVNRTSLTWSLTKDKQNGISCHLEL